MEVIERAQYDSCNTGDNIINNFGGFHETDKRKTNNSDTLSLVRINSKTDYVARKNVKYCRNQLEVSQEKSENMGKVIGNISQNSHHKNENSSSSNSIHFEQIEANKLPLESHQFISEILEQIETLTSLEKLLLYLKLQEIDKIFEPLKQITNPLGSRVEISQTINWIKANYEENENISIPKQVIYTEYMEYCSTNGIKPLSNADFGKVMKQVFIHVRPRRLGTRGNSRYCYSGMCRKRSLSPPLVTGYWPDEVVDKNITDTDKYCFETPQNCVCQWASEQIGHKFLDLPELALYIQNNRLCTTGEQKEIHGTVSNFTKQYEKVEIWLPKKFDNTLKKKENLPSCSDVKGNPDERPSSSRRKRTKASGNTNRETISKTRKVIVKRIKNCDYLNKAVTDDHLTSVKHQNNTVCDNYDPVHIPVDNNSPAAGSHDLILPDGSTKLKDLLVSYTNQKNKGTKRRRKTAAEGSMTEFPDVDANLSKSIKKGPDLLEEKNSLCIKENEKVNNNGQTSKLPIARLSKQRKIPINVITAVSSQVQPKQYKQIKPRPEKLNKIKKTTLKSDKTITDMNVTEKIIYADLKDKSLCTEVNVDCLEKDALDHYLDGDGNSQEQEEELLKNFQMDNLRINPIGSQVKLTKLSQQEHFITENFNVVNSNSDFNLKTTVLNNLSGSFNSADQISDTIMNDCDVVASDKKSNRFLMSQENQHCNKSDIVLPSIDNIHHGLSTQRRVAVETLHSQRSESRQQIHGSFIPISPTDKIKAVTPNFFVLPSDTPLSGMKSSLSHKTNISPRSPNVTSVWCSNSLPQISSLQNSELSSPALSPILRSRSAVNLPENIQTYSPFIDVEKSASTLRSSVQINSNCELRFMPPYSLPFPPSDSPAFNNNAQNSSPNISDKILNKSGTFQGCQTPSILEQILLSGKSSDYKSSEENGVLFGNVEDSIISSKSSCSSGKAHSTDLLSPKVREFFPEENSGLPIRQIQPAFRVHSTNSISQEVREFFPEENSSLPTSQVLSEFRLQPVPLVSSNELISLLSVQQPDMSPLNDENLSSSIPIGQIASESMQFNASLNTESSTSNFLLPNVSDLGHVSEFSDQNIVECNILLESDVSTNLKNIFELIEGDCKSVLNYPENCKILQQISRSHPSTPLPLGSGSNNCDKGDPMVSAFLPNVLCVMPFHQNSRSYPSTPIAPVMMPSFSDTLSEFLSNNENAADGICDSENGSNISLFIDNNILTDVDSLALQNLTEELPDC